MNKAGWIGALTAAVTIVAALGAGLHLGGGPTTRDGREAASWAVVVTAATAALAPAVTVWVGSRPP